MSSFTSFDDLHFGGLAEKRIAHCSLCQDEVEVVRDECTACGNRITQTSEGNNTYTAGSATSPFGVRVDDFVVDNENSPISQETHVRRIYELLSNMGVHIPVEALSEIDSLPQSQSVSKNLFDKLPKFTIENSIEEHPELRSDSFTIEGYPGCGGFSITVGEFGKGQLKHNKVYQVVLASPLHANQNLTNAVEVKDKIVVCLRGKSSFAKKGLLCQSAGAIAVLVLNTLDVWPFTMGDSKGEGEDLAIPTAMCKKDDGERLLELLKEKKQMEIKFNIREAKDTSCGICLDNYSKGDEIVQLPCLHFYHAKCINAWFKVNNTCPVCRKEIWDEDDKDNQQERQRRNGVRMGQAVSIENMYL